MCTVDLRLSIAPTAVFQGLTDQAIGEIKPIFASRATMPARSSISPGIADRLYVVVAGKVKLIRHAPTGQEVVLDLLVPGDFFGSLPVLRRHLSGYRSGAHHLLRP